MYGPQAGKVAARLAAMPGAYGRCFVDLAAQGPSFVSAAGVAAASRCVSSGVPNAAELPAAKAYRAAYHARFHRNPGTWGPFVYDSLNMLAAAAKRTHRLSGPKLRHTLQHTRGFKGVTGTITIEPKTGNRAKPPVVILDINTAGHYTIDPSWAAYAGYH
jgi:ABC-type branched-subunit amino acid transport system substrate-binding protein